MKHIFLTTVLFLCLFSFSHAQFDSSVASQEAIIELTPFYPEPKSEFTASLNDYSLPAQVSAITWKVNNIVVPEAKNQRTVTLTAGGLGKSTVVEAVIELAGSGVTKTVRKEITPIYLDIIVEPQTRTPSFYLGRALPSLGSTINLSAIVSGASVPQSNLLYTWRVNNIVIEGGSQRGRNKTSAPIPYGQGVLISLDVAKLDGRLLATKNIQVRTVSPKIYFYESSSLYGLKNKPLTNISMLGDSVVVQAEPYNLDIKTYNYPDHLTWNIDGNESPNSFNKNPYEITLARPEGYFTGTSNINFHVRNLSQILQGAEGDFTINF